jgi:long-chain acyl-CoA synthetase
MSAASLAATPAAPAGPGPAVDARPWLSHYPPDVSPTMEIPDGSLPALVEESVRRWPDRAALVYYGARWSYRRFWELTGRFAVALARDGIWPGDRVALYLPNCPAYPIAFFGALRAGAAVVPISPLYVAQDLARVVRDGEPKALVTLEILYPNLAKIAQGTPIPPAYVARLREFYPGLKRPFVNRVLRRKGYSTEFPAGPGVRSFRAALGTPGAPPAVGVRPAETVAVYQFTGGTTGIPKAAMLTHRNLVANALQCKAWFTLGAPGTGVVLATVPFFHVYGMTVALNFPLAEGASIVMQTRPDPDEILELVRRYRPTEFPGVPALYQALNQHPRIREYDLRSIRVCVSGSAPLPLEVARRFEALTGGHLIEGYGLTEASPVTHANPIRGERREGSIGLPLPLTDHRVVDLETGTRVLGPGERGELQVRGPQVMLGYDRRPEETRAVLREGWLSTGDVATLDEDGYAYIVDRKKDMIDVGGLKVYPREVEEVLYQHPDVKDAAVVGVPDSARGEVVRAFVVRTATGTVTEAELIAFVRERIAHYKAPRRIEFRAELPRTGVQKVLRRALREEATAAAGA